MVNARRVAVFIDYQNVYMGARAAFFEGTHNHVDGQVDPLKVGRHLKGLRDTTRELVAVRVYRGMPSSEKDPKGYAASYRQVTLWSQHPLVTPCTRPLNYRMPHEPREKGIDVLIAVDMVKGAMRNEYDIAVLFSGDTDLLPALEAIAEVKGELACETADWRGTKRPQREPLGVKGYVIHKHRLDRSAYSMVQDSVDYNLRRRRR